MYFAYVKYNALKDQTQFTFSFPVTSLSKLEVKVDGRLKVLTSDYTSANGVVQFNQLMLGGEVVEIRRVTNLNQREVDFSNTAILTEEHLDISSIQLFHALQEALDRITLLGG